PQLDLSFRFMGDSLEIDINSSYSFNNAVSSLNNTSTPYTTENYGGDIRWRVKGGWYFGLEGQYTKNSLPGDGFFNTDFFVLNGEIGKYLLKTQNLQVSIRGNDMLNQNINARREVNGNIITD